MLLLINTNCNLFELSDNPRVIETFPVDGDFFLSPDDVEYIVIIFDKKIMSETLLSRVVIKRIIIENVEEENFPFKIVVSDDKKFKIVPENKFKYGFYKVIIRKGVETENGSDMKDDYIFYFRIGNDTTKLKIVEISFPFGIQSYTNFLKINVVFSKNINTNLIYKNIEISPSINYLFDFDITNKILVIYSTGFVEYGRYNLNIKGELEDIFNNKLDKPTNVSFSIGNDFDIPYITGIFTNIGGINFLSIPFISNMGKLQPFYITFSEDVDKDSVKNSISFVPFLNFDIELSSNIAKVFPINKWDVEKEYFLKINRGVKDVFGNESTNIIEKYLYISNENSFHLRITNIVCCDMVSNSWYNNIVNSIYFPQGLWSTTNVNMIVYFNSPLRVFSVLDKVRIERKSGGDNNIPEVQKVSFSNNNSMVIFNISGLLLDDTSVYILKFAGGENGIIDVYSNFIDNNVEFYFKITN